MDVFYRNMIDLLKQQVVLGNVNDNDVSALLLNLGKEIDRCKVYNKPSAGFEKLYDDALWLKCEISK